jgi:hypothetical protein
MNAWYLSSYAMCKVSFIMLTTRVGRCRLEIGITTKVPTGFLHGYIYAIYFVTYKYF